MSHSLPQLEYAYDVMEPTIDARTMELHHTKHHQTYVDKLNKALESHPELAEKPIDELIANIESVPEDIRTAVRNNGGGHLNHSFWWTIIGPNQGQMPQGQLAEKINQTFGGFDAFKEKFEAAALNQFGSGYAWLVKDASGNLAIESTLNQETPLSKGKTPLLTLDVWEHAYYLKYQNRRAEYAKAFWNVVNWKRVAEYFEGQTNRR